MRYSLRFIAAAAVVLLAACQQEPVAPDPSFARQPPTPPPPADPAIAYGYGFGLWVMNADGTNKTRLLQVDESAHGYYASWSPDGTKLAISFVVSGQGWGIYTVGRDGSGLKLLVPLPEGFMEMPAWSPVPDLNGFYWIAYATDPPPYLPEDNLGANDIYIVREDGAVVVRLTETPSTHEGKYITWAPTGDRLAIRNTEYDLVTHAQTGSSLYVYPFDWATMSLGAPVDVVPPGSPLAADVVLQPDWARTSDRIAVRWGCNIWVIALSDPAHPVQITTHGTNQCWSEPTWSPDDSRIAVVGDRTILSMRADGTDIKDLGPFKRNLPGPSAPAWRRNP